MMKPVYEPLDEEKFKERLRNIFPSVYLTIISIIQGVALGFLITNSFQYIQNSYNNGDWIQYLPYSALSFLVIVIVFYEYTWFIAIFNWSFRILDILVPFTLGCAEIAPIFYLDSPIMWWYLTGLFCFIGAIGFSYSLLKCRRTMFCKNEKAYKRIKKALIYNIIIALIATLVCGLAGLLSSSSSLYKLFSLGSLLTILLFLLYKEEKFMEKLHNDFGYDR